MWNYCPLDGYRFQADQKLCPVCLRLRGKLKEEEDTRHGAPWRKVLYVKQPYPDNYTDTSFLAMLRMNPNKRHYSYWAVVRESGAVTQHISAVCILGAIFAYVDAAMLSGFALLALVLTVALLFLAWCFVSQSKFPVPSAQGIKGVGLAMFALLGLTPVLRTLTSSISTDTIHATAILTLAATAVTTDYSRTPRRQLSGLNEAMFGSVCLASRLPTSVHAFALLMLALELFGLLPFVSRAYRGTSTRQFVSLTLGLVLLAAGLVAPLSRTLAVLYLATVATITYLLPIWLVRALKYKREIRGPWDEAVVMQASQMLQSG
eukprot:comp6854_c0_seq1/m.2600 comp6854_c0_seq1/g.2600  ORF comp6854_c0_seq1/g.2600 comp6854_c0_seq1/m.2600 type:complete len:319 (-) comp6854_c0_seq1:20-976(-)